MSRADVSIEDMEKAHLRIGPTLNNVEKELLDIMFDMHKVCNNCNEEMHWYMTLLTNLDRLRSKLEIKMLNQTGLRNANIYHLM